MASEICACGQPLHYADPLTRETVEKMIASLGECMEVTIYQSGIYQSGRKFLIPRHFIALHGIRGSELPALAERYGFKEVK